MEKTKEFKVGQVWVGPFGEDDNNPPSTYMLEIIDIDGNNITYHLWDSTGYYEPKYRWFRNTSTMKGQLPEYGFDERMKDHMKLVTSKEQKECLIALWKTGWDVHL